jgi:hypothetical protein
MNPTKPERVEVGSQWECGGLRSTVTRLEDANGIRKVWLRYDRSPIEVYSPEMLFVGAHPSYVYLGTTAGTGVAVPRHVELHFAATDAWKRYDGYEYEKIAGWTFKREVDDAGKVLRSATLVRGLYIEDSPALISEAPSAATPTPATKASVAPACRACGAELLPANRPVADGCPCNSKRGVNHGIVDAKVCTCATCDPAQTGASRWRPTAKAPRREVSTDGRTWINYETLADADPFESYRHRRENGVVAAIVETPGVRIAGTYVGREAAFSGDERRVAEVMERINAINRKPPSSPLPVPSAHPMLWGGVWALRQPKPTTNDRS